MFLNKINKIENILNINKNLRKKYGKCTIYYILALFKYKKYIVFLYKISFVGVKMAIVENKEQEEKYIAIIWKIDLKNG